MIQSFISLHIHLIQPTHYVLREEYDPALIRTAIHALVAARKQTHLLEAWEIFPPDLTIGESLGSGKFGDVYNGVLGGDVAVAVKSLKQENCTEAGLNEFEREADIMKVFFKKKKAAFLSFFF